jgi:hypothetical protein
MALACFQYGGAYPAADAAVGWRRARRPVDPPLLRAGAGRQHAIRALCADAQGEGGGRVVLACPAPLLRLPFLFDTRVETIPARIPYLAPPPSTLKAKPAFAGAKDLKIGLVWAGNARQDNLLTHAIDRRRSMALEQLAPLATLPGLRFVSLQRGDAAQQLEKAPPGFDVVDPMGGVTDFADTAALMLDLDLVIGVDTSVIHLAGAMGKPVWCLSRFDGCWRWLADRDDSPWYPTMRLFRQEMPGDWAPVVERVRAALEEWAATRR